MLKVFYFHVLIYSNLPIGYDRWSPIEQHNKIEKKKSIKVYNTCKKYKYIDINPNAIEFFLNKIMPIHMHNPQLNCKQCLTHVNSRRCIHCAT